MIMDAERSSLCNWVVNFLLEENYLLTAFELLHELLDDGRDDQAIRLKQFFSDPSQFPPDQISRFNSLRVADPQSLLEEKITLEEKLAVSEYELRLAQEDTRNLRNELLKKNELMLDESNGPSSDAMTKSGPAVQPIKSEKSLSDMGPLKDNERLDLNCAVKEYLLLAGYRLTAMTFHEEVTDQNLDVWQNPSACVSDALRHYYYQYMSSTAEAAEEKIAMLREKESLLKENDRLKTNQQSLLKRKELSDAQVTALTKSLEALQRDIKDKENLVQDLTRTLEAQRKELNDCRAEITSLKMYIEEACSGKNLLANDAPNVQSLSGSHDDELKQFPIVQSNESTKGEDVNGREFYESEEPRVNDDATPAVNSLIDLVSTHADVVDRHETNVTAITLEEPKELAISSGENESDENIANFLKDSSVSLENGKQEKLDMLEPELNIKEMALGTIQILSDSLPKIVPYVLINHREELLPLIMCAIERHPESSTRDSLTHTLFNLIKRPDEQQRRIIMDACVTLAKNVGELRTETELLPQCWEQINHMYEERRLLVAQSCGDLAKFVRPEIRDSLILSIVQQLMEDPATVVREAAAHNLALLLPLFPNTDKYIKVEEIMFQLICDPAGVVVETTMKELVPALVKWGNKLDHILQILLSHILGSAQRCPPLSGVEGSVESHHHVLGERERWNIDVLLRLLAELLPYVHQKAIKTCPFLLPSDSTGTLFSIPLLEQYAEGNVEWPVFEWLHIECFPNLIHLTSLLPQKEDHLRNRVTRFLLAVAEHFGEPYLTNIMLPVFLLAVGDNADLKFFPFKVQSKIRDLKPLSSVSQKLATMCTLPLLLAGILGHPSKHEQLAQYLRNLLIQNSKHDNQPAKHEIIHSVRFICTVEENHTLIVNILWEMVASSNVNVKITAANLLKVIVPFIDAKVASAHVLPALVTLGSDQNLTVKYASIDAFGAVAQHLKNDTIVEKIRVQMDAFLEDGSHEATIAVVRSLLIAVPHTTDRLRDYLVSKIYQFTASQSPSTDVTRRRERADAFCEAIRALDATDVSPSSVRDFLIPSIQNLLRDTDALDPAHKEALEIILKERSGGTLDAISKVMGAHLGLPSSVTSFFGESGLLLGKKDSGSIEPVASSSQPQAVEPVKIVQQQTPPPQAEDTRLRRIMRGGFTDMLRGRAKSSEDMSPNQ